MRYLAKARALCDSVTRAQQPDGMIPTHWMTGKHLRGTGMWINCMFMSAATLAQFAGYLDGKDK